MILPNSYFETIWIMIMWIIFHLSVNPAPPVDMEALECDIHVLFEVLGSDLSKTICEQECEAIVHHGNIVKHSCPIACDGLQKMTKVGYAVWSKTLSSKHTCGHAPANVREWLTRETGGSVPTDRQRHDQDTQRGKPACQTDEK